jgi:hypothetical protein
MTEKLSEWKHKRFTVPLINGDGRPRDLEEIPDEQSGEHHLQKREAERAASTRTASEVKALEDSNKALARRLARLEEDQIPLPEYMVGVDTEGGDVGGNVKATKEEPPTQKDRIPHQEYHVKVRGDTVGGGD